MQPPILQGFCSLLAFPFYLFSKGKERKFFLIMISPEVRYKFRTRVLILLIVIKWAFPPYLSLSLIKKKCVHLYFYSNSHHHQNLGIFSHGSGSCFSERLCLHSLLQEGKISNTMRIALVMI